MERELAEAQDEARMWEKRYNEILATCAQAGRERDKVRKENEKLYQWTAINGVLELEKERKEARAEAEKLAAAIRRHRDAMLQDSDETSVEDRILWDSLTTAKP